MATHEQSAMATSGGEPHSPPGEISGQTVIDVLDKARRFLWLFVELGFLSVLAIVLIYLVLGENSGIFVQSVVDNVLKFAGAVPTPSLVGLAIVGMLIYVIAQRMK
jgi:hypothetical protein